jgi:CRISPR type III-A-associated protein Csm2
MRGSTAEEPSIRREALLLRPKFAYAVSRKPALRPLYLVTEAMMEKLQREGKEWRRDFQELINFMEAVVAYYDYK